MTPNLDLWQRASHAQMGRGLDRANSESMQLRNILDDDDPIHVAFMSGMGYILGLVYHELEYLHCVTKSRNFASVTDQALASLANLKETAMPVKEAQVDEKLTELQIDPTVVKISADFKPLFAWQQAQRLEGRNITITGSRNKAGLYECRDRAVG